MMKLKKNVKVSYEDFWYDLTDGGYIKPEEILANPEDFKCVMEAIMTLKEFQDTIDSLNEEC